MESVELWFLLLLAICMQLSSLVLSQIYPDQTGFISIDCGSPSGTIFKDTRGISYVSDDLYIDTGKNYNIAQNYKSPSKQASTLRSFPNGTRNCYKLWNVTKGSKYLLRTTFMYGNYDGNQMAQISNPLQFDLHVDISFWRRVNITDASSEYAHEVVIVAVHDLIWVCLLNINAGTPFISALELRPLKSALYPYVSEKQANPILFRLNYGPTENVVIRYPDDPYDRIWSWYQYDTSVLTNINTTADITRAPVDTYFEPPNSVLRTALTPISSPNLTTVSIDPPSNYAGFQGFYFVLYMVELQNLSGNQSRQYDIYINDYLLLRAETPEHLTEDYKYATQPFQYNHSVLKLVQLKNSTLPPILNGMEVYWTMIMEVDSLTSPDDVNAIVAVKVEYGIVRNWNGDPCSPTNLSWYGVSCSNNELSSRITSLNLSNAGLSGRNISNSFAKLQEIVYLDLSYNNLSGDIPDSLTSMSALRVLNLSGNHLNGHVPDALIKKNTSGDLLLLVDSCTNCEGQSKKGSSTIIIAIIVAVVIIVVITMALILYRRTRRRSRRGIVEQNFETEVHSETRKFTHQELKDITNNFSRIIGRGGFGVVYHGYLENEAEVAVKVCSQGSGQGNKQFLAETRSLSLMHHKNIVALVGHCKDGDTLAVVYEYMPRGSLFDHLRGKDSTSEPLNWRIRLNITLEAAQALDYLHTGCDIVHRDMKSSNILLGQNFEAKVSDLGLARMFSADPNSSLYTLSGTPGYIDPEYQRTFTLNKKSDVYSFGVIMLEIVTGQPPISNASESIHIVQLVKQKLEKGSIEEVIDSQLEGEYDTNCVWKVMELAMMCTAEESIHRPTMTDVVVHLRDSVQMEENHQKGKLRPSDISNINSGSVSTSSSISLPPAPATR